MPRKPPPPPPQHAFRRVYHFNYVAHFKNTTDEVGSQGEVYTNGAWSSNSAPQLYAWNDKGANGRFVAWSTDLPMAAGDRFRVVNGNGTRLNDTYIFQQLSGYLVGAAPVGAVVNLGSSSVVADSSLFSGASGTIVYENKGACTLTGFTSNGYIASRTGLYQLQVRNTSCSLRLSVCLDGRVRLRWMARPAPSGFDLPPDFPQPSLWGPVRREIHRHRPIKRC